MDHRQNMQEKHRKDRAEKQADERKSEQNFSKAGPAIRPVWALVVGIALTLTALLIWMRLYATP